MTSLWDLDRNGQTPEGLEPDRETHDLLAQSAWTLDEAESGGLLSGFRELQSVAVQHHPKHTVDLGPNRPRKVPYGHQTLTRVSQPKRLSFEKSMPSQANSY
ncbi:MAG: hypothetical protein M1835_005235, partial [Candelina submexicana]